jgi:hypothetical protein
VAEGEAEDRVVAGSNPALGTLKLNLSLFCQNTAELRLVGGAGICSQPSVATSPAFHFFTIPFFILFLNLPTAEWQFSARTEK